MGIYAFRLTIRPGTEEEYVKRHQEVYPDLLQAFKEVGVQTYRIYLDGCNLFAYMEVDDFASVASFLSDCSANIRWQNFMSDILVRNEHGETMEPLREVFHFES